MSRTTTASRVGERPAAPPTNPTTNNGPTPTMERPATAQDLPGAFLGGKRVVTPSGKFLPRTRPISQLAARLRGVCTTSQEDQQLSTQPLSVSCGSPTMLRQQLCSRGRALSTPPGTYSRSQITKLQKPVTVPRLASMEVFLTEAAKLTNRSTPFRLQPSASCTTAAVKTAFGETASSRTGSIDTAVSTNKAPTNAQGTKQHDLHMWWQNKTLQSGKGPASDPSILCGIENITEQDQLPRTATLLHALLSLNANIDQGSYPVVVENNELVGLQPLHRLCRHTRVVDDVPPPVSSHSLKQRGLSFSGRGSPAAAPGGGEGSKVPIVERLHYYEDARHIIVARGRHLYKMEVLDEGGRILQSSELLKGFTSIVAQDSDSPSSQPSCGLDLTRLSFLPAQDYATMKAEVKAECKSNALCLEALEGALLYVELSNNGAETAEDPTIATPHQAWYHGNVCSLHVYPNGNAVLRASALTLDTSLLMCVASTVAHDANCDPMLEYVPEPPVVVQATRLIVRAPTPVTGKKPPKKGAVEPDEIMVQEVPVTLPEPQPAPTPKRLPLWMPSSYCNSKTVPAEVAPTRVHNFTVQVKHEASLHTAVLLALKHMRPTVEFPLLHVVKHSAVRDPTLQLCVTNEVESALRHLSSFAAPCGPLRTEVERCCGNAVNSLTALLKEGTPHVSNFSRLLHSGLLEQQHAKDTLEGELLGRADMHITRHPHHPDVLWCLRSPTWVDPSQRAKQCPPPMVSYTLVPAGRSSLRAALGSLCNCSLAISPYDQSMPPESVEEFISVVKQFVKFVDQCAEKQKQKQSGSVPKPFALRRIL